MGQKSVIRWEFDFVPTSAKGCKADEISVGEYSTRVLLDNPKIIERLLGTFCPRPLLNFGISFVSAIVEVGGRFHSRQARNEARLQ